MKKCTILFLLLPLLVSAQNNHFKFRNFETKTIVSNSEKDLYFIRLDKINRINTIKIKKNTAVAKQVKRYLGFKHLPLSMGKAEHYFYFIKKKLKKYGLPEELKYLAVIESDLNPSALSKVGAKGLWQFMPKTGAQYGLYENENVSLFFDPIASTDAACRYLKDLYKQFKDWEIVLAAYNCGPGRVSRILKKSSKKDFWSIRKSLPQETQNYVASFLAVQYIFNFFPDHNIKPRKIKIKSSTIKTWVNKKKVSKSKLYSTESERRIFEFLNPHLLTNIIPIRTRFYLKELPEKSLNLFYE